MSEKSSIDENSTIQKAVEITLRLALLFLLLYWCWGIIRPFADFIAWSVIFAVALYPAYSWLNIRLGDRKILASLLVVLTMIVLFLLPVVFFAESMYEGIVFMKTQYDSTGSLLPAASEQIASLPVVGPMIFEKWNTLAADLGASIQEYAPQLRDVSLAVISSIASVGYGFLKLFVSIIISGFLLVNSKASEKLAYELFTKILGNNGLDYAILSQKTIRTVVKGILGVAFIQAMLFGIGMAVIGVPAAGLLFILSLILAIVQVGILPVAIPVVIYVFAVYSTPVAVIFLIWTIFVYLIESVLKPILLGKGAIVPMPVIFIGAIGGFIYSGFVGLFTGAVVFSVGYKLFILWLDRNEAENSAIEE